jgi:quercetin dioxygenase-like cupin family protein
LRRSLESGNAAAVVAASKALLELDRVEVREQPDLEQRAPPTGYRGAGFRDVIMVAREAGVIADDLLDELRAIKPGAQAAVTDDGDSNAGRAIARRAIKPGTVSSCSKKAMFVSPGDGEWLEREDRGFRLLAQLPDLEVVEGTFEHGWEGVDPHTHSDHTDSFYVIEGEVEFLVDGEWRRGGPGTFFSAPRGVQHGVRNPGPGRIRVVNIHAPNTGFVERMRR